MKKIIPVIISAICLSACSDVSKAPAAEGTDAVTTVTEATDVYETAADMPQTAIYYETWEGVPEDNWGINPFHPVVTEAVPAETVTGTSTAENNMETADVFEIYGVYIISGDEPCILTEDDRMIRLINVYDIDLSVFVSHDYIKIETDIIYDEEPPECPFYSIECIRHFEGCYEA